ncbi:MAG: heavy metal translocating P-type ATPase, partial [Desulfobacterales bacterium]|nr:heavy metal translocating P-type ATPase [Desulfobacterales bacterium]
MSVIHSIPGRVRYSAASAGGVGLIKEKALELFADLDIQIQITYNPRTRRGLLIFTPDARLTRILTDLIDLHARELATVTEASYPLAVPRDPQPLSLRHPVLSITGKVLNFYATRMFMPPVLRPFWCIFNMAPLIWRGFMSLSRGRLDVDVLDAAAIVSALFMRDFNTAGTILLLMEISETLEEWTREKSKGDIASLFSPDDKPIWIMRKGEPVAIPSHELELGDLVVVRSGGRIPVDGVVADGLAMVNQSSMTGEPMAVKKMAGSEVYAGTTIEEGKIIILSEAVGVDTRFAKIAKILTESEGMKAQIHSQAEKLADKIVPLSFILSGIVFAFTRNMRQAATVLLADYSCAIKLATPLAVRAGMLETAKNGVVLKGGKHLESMSKLDTIVLDKTGTLTQASPEVVKICPTNGFTREFVLSQAACMEEHFPHPIADAVIRKADEEGLEHDEDHAEVEYILAHGIATTLDGQRTVLGSRHCVHEDEGIDISQAEIDIQACRQEGLSLLYLACGNKLAGVIAVKDPVREDAEDFIRQLESRRMKRIIMLTGDNRETAANVAEELGIREYYAQVLPDEKTQLIKDLKSQGHVVAMVGDGI